MPVIRNLLPDPTDLVIQGELMRRDVFEFSNSDFLMTTFGTQIAATLQSQAPPLITPFIESNRPLPDDEAYTPMHSDFTPYHSRLRDTVFGNQIANNAVICTPMGAIIPSKNIGVSGILMSKFTQSTQLWTLSGISRDNAGSVLAVCRVVLLQVCEIKVAGFTVIAETISDGSGNYSFTVPREDTAYQVIMYNNTVPVAGISVNTLVPIAAV